MTRWIVVSGLLLAAGCSRGKAGEVVPAPQPVTIEVKNQHALPVTIEVTGNGTRYHLGKVLPGLTAFFKVPANVTSGGSVELVVTPSTNARPFTSGPLLLAPAAVVDLIVSARLFNSTATIRP